MKRIVTLFAAAGTIALLGVAAHAQQAPATATAPVPEWSEWRNARGHFQFQLRAEEAGPGVMKVRMRIRPNVERIAREPHYSDEPYYLEYYQGIDKQFTGGLGDTTMSRPRRLMFPPNAPETCVYQEESLYSRNARDGVHMDHSISPQPMMTVDDRLVSAFELVVQFGNNIGPGNVVRFSGVDRSSFKSVC